MAPDHEAAIASTVDPGEIVTVEAADHARLKGRFWRASASGPLLVAAHGVMSHSLWFHQLAASLRRLGISLLAFDRRGSGMTRDDPGEPLDDRTLSDDLAAWLDFAGTIADDVHLVGFCWGANHVLHSLGKRTEGIQSLILMAPGIVPSSAVAARHATANVAKNGRMPIQLDLEDFTQGPALDEFLRPDPLRLTETSLRFVEIQKQIGSFSAARLVRLRLPLLTILASIDEISDNARTRKLLAKTSATPNRIVEVEGRHGLIFDAPDNVANLCRNWLDRLHPDRS